MSSTRIGYVASVTEFEWGFRPDGYLVCLDRKEGITVSTSDHGYLCRFEDGYCMAGGFDMCVLTEYGYNKLCTIEDNTLWITNKDFDKFVSKT